MGDETSLDIQLLAPAKRQLLLSRTLYYDILNILGCGRQYLYDQY